MTSKKYKDRVSEILLDRYSNTKTQCFVKNFQKYLIGDLIHCAMSCSYGVIMAITSDGKLWGAYTSNGEEKAKKWYLNDTQITGFVRSSSCPKIIQHIGEPSFKSGTTQQKSTPFVSATGPICTCPLWGGCKCGRIEWEKQNAKKKISF